MIGIYAITHTQSGRVYVGQSVNIQRRWAQHRRMLAMGAHDNPKLQHAWSKYGERAFSFSILEEAPARTDLLRLEQKWLDHFRVASGVQFNIRAFADDGRGVSQSPELRRKRSETRRGIPKPPGFGARVSAALRGRKKSPEHVEKVRLARIGLKHTAESRKKMAASHMGKTKTVEQRARQSEITAAWHARRRAGLAPPPRGFRV